MGLLDQLQAYIQANTPRNTRKPVSPAQVIDEGLLGGRIGQMPQRAAEMQQGILNIPQDLAQLASPQMKQTVNQAMNKPQQANPQQWMDAGMELSGMAPVGGLLGATVYHGSPHKFDKFDMSKIGTGEGAQAYGHGLYFAESPGVAKSYQNALTDGANKFTLDNTGFSQLDRNGQYAVENYVQMLREGATPEAAIARLNEKAGSGLQQSRQNYSDAVAKRGRTEDMGEEWGDLRYYKYTDADIAASKKALDEAEAYQALLSKLKPSSIAENEGAFYKVDIPDESIPRMLDWDKPLSEQAQHIQEFAKQNGIKEFYNGANNPEFGGFIRSPNYGEGLYGDLSDLLGGKVAATEAMRKAGIPGIRYLDGMSRNAGEGSSNYVLFDDQISRILEVNGQPTGLLSWADEAKRTKQK